MLLAVVGVPALAPLTPLIAGVKLAAATPNTASLKVTVKLTDAAFVGLVDARLMLSALGASLSIE